MLRMACMECRGVEVEANSWQSMLVKMMPHYFEHHRDIISVTPSARPVNG